MKPERGPQTMFLGHRWLWSHCCATSNGNLNILSRAARKKTWAVLGARYLGLGT